MSESAHQAKAARQELLRLAELAYRDRVTWTVFWRSIKHKPEANATYGRMLKMVVSGDLGGMFAAGDDDGRMPWDRDNDVHVDDTATVARCQLQLPGFGPVSTMTTTGGSESR